VPSCFGDELWRFVIWDRCADPDHWARAFAALAEGNRAWASDVPILMVADEKSFSKGGGPRAPGAWSGAIRLRSGTGTPP
jgi:hypothetical protein